MIEKEFSPFTNLVWQALQRECYLVRQLLGSGVTALGKADYSDKGKYYLAFFEISIGIERLTKLILVIDYTIQNAGVFPEEKEIKGYGHNIKKLLEKVLCISTTYNITLSYPRKNRISDIIIDFFDCFADATKGRYANFNALKNNNKKEFEPISKWYNEVDKLILDQHFNGTSRGKESYNRAVAIADAIKDITMCLYINESGDSMSTQDIVLCGTLKDTLMRYRRYYTLFIIRNIAEVFIELSQQAVHQYKINEFSGLYEFFQGFRIEDKFLKKTKVWPAF